MIKNYFIIFFLFTSYCFCMDFARLQNELREERAEAKEQINQVITKKTKRYNGNETETDRWCRLFHSKKIHLNDNQAKRALHWAYPKITKDFFGPDRDIGTATKKDCVEKLYEIKNLLKQKEQKGTAPYTWDHFYSFFCDFYGFEPLFPVSIKDLYNWGELQKGTTEINLWKKQVNSLEGLESGVQEIDLSLSLLREIGPHAFPDSLRSLNLSANRKITQIDFNAFANLCNLAHLEFTDAELETIPQAFLSLVALKTLDLRRNKITTISEGTLPTKLEILLLIGNKINTIEKNAFVALKALKTLDLSYNSLTSLRCTLPASLTELYLRFNYNLDTLDPTIFCQKTEKSKKLIVYRRRTKLDRSKLIEQTKGYEVEFYG